MSNLQMEIGYFLNHLGNVFTEQFAHRGWFEWLLFFFPFYVFGEFPRYVFPGFGVLFLRLLGLWPDDDEKKRRFLATSPSVSVLLVGYNEEKTIAGAIRSLLDLDYPNMEIIVVDDGSTDAMYEKAKPFADQGLIQLYRNSAATGRGGRPAASSLALKCSSGDYILSVDADTSFDRGTILHMIGSFYDPSVGIVAGNLKVRNLHAGFWPRVQAIEYLLSITLWKSWLDLAGMNLQASGAFGAFRRKALLECGGWDPELGEDADLSLKVKKSGWKLVFARKAIAMTTVPSDLKTLIKQRYRWDRGTLRTYFHKHGDLFHIGRYGWRSAVELSIEYIFSVFLTFLYPIWFSYMLWFYPLVLIIVLGIAMGVYTVSTLIPFLGALSLSERWREEWVLLFDIPGYLFYKGIFRWVRFYAMLLETLRVNYETPYLPESAWRNSEKW